MLMENHEVGKVGLERATLVDLSLLALRPSPMIACDEGVAVAPAAGLRFWSEAPPVAVALVEVIAATSPDSSPPSSIAILP